MQRFGSQESSNMFGPLKLGAAAGIGYAVGGKVGTAVLKAFKDDASADTVTGAAWAGRIAVFFAALTVLNRIA
jgi:hypothetical protein